MAEKMGELLKCGDFVGKLCAREENADGKVVICLHRPSFVTVAGVHYWVNDYRVTVEAHCERADPSEVN